MKERRLIFKESAEYADASVFERVQIAEGFLANQGRIAAVSRANIHDEVVNSVSEGVRRLDPVFSAWTDVAGDEDGKLETTRGYKDGEVADLQTVFGMGAAIEARLNLRGSILGALNQKFNGLSNDALIRAFESREARLKDIDRLQVLEILQTRLVLLLNSNPRVEVEAREAAKIYGAIKKAIGGVYEENPNGLPWVFAASGHGNTPHSLNVMQGWGNYTPLADVNGDYLQVYGVIGTATEVHRILFDEAKRIQFSSRFAPKAAEEILYDKLLNSIVWAVPDFVQRYCEDSEFKILADSVLRLVARRSWIAYSDGFGNVIGQERFDENRVAETVDAVSDGETVRLIVNGKSLEVVKVSRLADAAPGRICIYLNGEDSRKNFNLVVPWAENRDVEEIKKGLGAQGVDSALLTREIARTETLAVIKGEGLLRLSANNLLMDPTIPAGLSGLEVRVLPKDSDKTGNALKEVQFVDSLVRSRK